MNAVPRERIPLGSWSTVSAHPYTVSGVKKNGAKRWRRLTEDEANDLKAFSDLRWRASVYYRGKNGKRQRAEAWAPSRAAAIRAVNKKLPERVETVITPWQTRVTLADLAAAWWREFQAHGKQREQTKQGYEDSLRRHVLPLLGGYSVQEITTGLLTSKLQELGESTPSAPRLARIVLKHIFTYAKQHDLVDGDPVQGTPSFREPPKEVETASLDQLQKLRAQIVKYQGDQTYGPARGANLLDVLDLMLVAGCRTGEALAVLASEVESIEVVTDDCIEAHYYVTFSGTIVQPRKGAPFRQEWTKTDAGYRRAQIPQVMAERLLSRAQILPSDLGLVFPARGGLVMSPNNFRTSLRRALEGTDLVGFIPYLMRKTAATEVKETLGIEVASKLLGHTSTAVTEKHYVRKVAAQVPDTSAVLGALLESASN